MALPGWVVVCIVLTVVLVMCGAALFVYGYRLSQQTKREAAYSEPGSPQALRDPPPVAVQTSSALIGGIAVAAPPPALNTQPKGPTLSGVPVLGTVEEHMKRVHDYQREIADLEGERWALENPWQGSVTVRLLGGGDRVVDASSTTTAGDLSAATEAAVGHPVLLSFGGRQLEPAKAIGVYRIGDGAVLHAVRREGEVAGPAKEKEVVVCEPVAEVCEPAPAPTQAGPPRTVDIDFDDDDDGGGGGGGGGAGVAQPAIAG